MNRRLSLVALVVALVPLSAVAADDPPVAEKFLLSGDLAGGDKALEAILKAKPEDGQARFGLGAIRFVGAVEFLVQGLYKHGLDPRAADGLIPFARLPIPPNPDPEPISYEDLRTLMQGVGDRLASAEATLAMVKDDSVTLPIRFGLIRLDFDGDGKASEEETLWKLYARLNRQAGQGGVTAEDAQGFAIAFDRGDVAWLRGYCHLLMAFTETYLAHDGRALFDRTAHLFFARPKTPFAFLKAPRVGNGFDLKSVGDLIAFVHLLNFPVKEPARMKAALGHLESVIALSRESWTFLLAETDDDREWIPNPKQATVVPGVRVTEEMVQGWMAFLDEAQAILAGKLLVPFWRDAGGKGINLRKVFTEPTDLDAVLWFQGTAAAPYLEEGPVTTPDVWRRLQRVFGGEFVGFALWFN